MISEAQLAKVAEHVANLRKAAELYEKYSITNGFVSLFEFSINVSQSEFDRLFHGKTIEKRPSVGSRYFDAHGQLDGVDFICHVYEQIELPLRFPVLCVCGEPEAKAIEVFGTGATS
jgi:hypothetical protein